jgi:hypothetical protein
MSQTHKGAILRAASNAGVSIEEYQERFLLGLKRCSKCKSWKPVDQFGADRTRYDGKEVDCFECRHEYSRLKVRKVRTTNGPPPDPPRHNDKRQARKRINQLILSHRLQSPSELPCLDCGHIGADRRHQYDHYLGYAAMHHLDVQPVCEPCHIKREIKRDARSWKNKTSRRTKR